MSGDWRKGQPAIQYARCRACDQVWDLTRPHCPQCGRPDPATKTTAGAGDIVAATRVERTPSAEWRALLPYTMAIVEAAKGFRMMAHAAPDMGVP